VIKNAPFCLDPLIDLMTTLLHTSCVESQVPISAVLVADSGTGKSKVIKMLSGEGLHHTNSFSSQGLFQLMQIDPENKIRYILLEDLNPTLSRQQKTVTATVANLLTLTMDGTCRVDDGRSEKILKHLPIGLISGVTPEIYKTQTKKWFSLGLTRRIIPIFYEYTRETERTLLDNVAAGKINLSDFAPYPFEHKGMHNPHIDISEAKILEGLAAQFSINLGMSRGKDTNGNVKMYVRKIVPISPTVILRTIAQANAIKHKRGKVGEEDITFVSRFLDFTNPTSPKQL